MTHNHREILRKTLFILLSLWVMTVSSFTVFAYDRNEAINLESDQLDINNKTGTLTYTGNVRLDQGEFTLRADLLVVFVQGRDVIRIEAKGQPVFLEDTQPDGKRVKAQANEMIYDITTESISLEGSGLLNHDGNIMQSQSILYNLKTSDLNAGASGKRVIMTLQPKKDSTRDE